MIKVDALTVQFGGIKALDALDAEFAAPICGLIGPNGAGKTTLLMMMARLLEPTRGDILIDGRDVSGIRIGDYAKRVATLRQSPDFNLRLTVEELVAFGRFPPAAAR